MLPGLGPPNLTPYTGFTPRLGSGPLTPHTLLGPASGFGGLGAGAKAKRRPERQKQGEQNNRTPETQPGMVRSRGADPVKEDHTSCWPVHPTKL